MLLLDSTILTTRNTLRLKNRTIGIIAFSHHNTPLEISIDWLRKNNGEQFLYILIVTTKDWAESSKQSSLLLLIKDFEFLIDIRCWFFRSYILKLQTHFAMLIEIGINCIAWTLSKPVLSKQSLYFLTIINKSIWNWMIEKRCFIS